MQVKVVIDVEMCRVYSKGGVFPYQNEIIQIGAVKMDGDCSILDSFSSFVRPRFGRIDRFIGKLTHISESDVHEAPELEEALLRMMRWIGGDDVVFYSWSRTDLSQIRKEVPIKCGKCSEWEILTDPSNWIDYQEQFMRRLKTSRQMKLSDALDLAELDVEGRLHDGLDDAYNTARMIAKLEKQKDYRTLIERARAAEESHKPLTASLEYLFRDLKVKSA